MLRKINREEEEEEFEFDLDYKSESDDEYELDYELGCYTERDEDVPNRSKLKPYPTIIDSLKAVTDPKPYPTIIDPVTDPNLNPVDPTFFQVNPQLLTLANSLLSNETPLIFPDSRYTENIERFNRLDFLSKQFKVRLITPMIDCLWQLDIHLTRRDLFYALFGSQNHSSLDFLLDYVTYKIPGISRWDVDVVVPENGLVVGNLSFIHNGQMVDCTNTGGIHGNPIPIPTHIDTVENVKSDALFILLVHKVSTYIRLVEDKFYEKFPCIIVMAKDLPNVKTRLFLIKLKKVLHFGLPIFALFDCNPSGFNILSSYMNGVNTDSSDSICQGDMQWLGPIKWIGLRPTDFKKYQIFKHLILPMTRDEIETGKKLLKSDFVKSKVDWKKELELMVKSKKKAEIEVLNSFSFRYLTEVYLPLKLQEHDWI